MNDLRIKRLIPGIELTIDKLFPESHSLKVEIWSNGTSDIVPSFYFIAAFLEPLKYYAEPACQKVAIPHNAKLFKIEVGCGMHPDDDNPLNQWIIARLYFWSNNPDPLLDMSIYLAHANTKVITTTLPPPADAVWQ